MATGELSTVVMNKKRRNTVLNLNQVCETRVRNMLELFDDNGDGKIDINELQRIMYWYGLLKYASVGLCMMLITVVWSTFGLTIWAIDVTKDYSVHNGVLANKDEVIKMSVASSLIPLNWASLLDRRHLDGLESITVNVTQSSGKFTTGVYHMKLASYLHSSSTELKLYGKDGSIVWINSGTVVLKHPTADQAIMLCGASICNTLAVDVTPDYLKELIKRSAAFAESTYTLGDEVEGISINKADGKGATCQAMKIFEGCEIDWSMSNYGITACVETYLTRADSRNGQFNVQLSDLADLSFER